MATLERTYNIPLRKEFMKAPRYKRANKAMKALREFLAKHMKSDHIIIGRYLNQKMWERSIKNPPHHVKVTAIKDEKGTVMAELVGAPKPQPKDEKGKKIQKETEELKEALSGELKKTEELSKTAEETSKAAETKVEEKPNAEKKAEEKKQKEAVPKAEKKPAESAEKKTAVKKPAKAKKEAEETA